MDNDYVLKQLRLVISDIYNDEGELRSEVRHNFISNSISDEAIYILKELLAVVLKVGYFSDVTRYYVKDRMITRKQLCDKLKMNKNTLNSKLYRDIKKFQNDFGTNCLVNIAQIKSTDLTQYKKKIFELTGTEKEFYDSIDLNLTNAYGAFNTKLDSERFDYICTVLNIYTKAYKNRIEKLFTSKDFGYINYLFSKIDKTEEEQLQFDKLLAMCGKLNLDSLSSINIYRDLGYDDSEINEKVSNEDMDLNLYMNDGLIESESKKEILNEDDDNIDFLDDEDLSDLEDDDFDFDDDLD